MDSAAGKDELQRGWRILIAALTGTAFGLPPVPFYSIGILAPFLAAEFGWSYANILGGLILTTLVLFFGGPVLGFIVDRFGPRRVAVISLVLMGAAYMSLALSTGSLVQYYASWTAIAVGGLGATSITFSRAISSHFDVRRGLALGIALAGTGVFAMLIKPVAAGLLSVVDWRTLVVFIGALPLLIGAPVVYWGIPEHQRSVVTRGAANSAEAGLSVSAALKTRVFWTLAIAFIPISFAVAAPLPNLENLLGLKALAARDVVFVTSLIGVAIITGRLIGGWLMDRFWAPAVGAGLCAIAGVGCWVLSLPVLSVEQAAFAAMGLGLAAGVEVDVLSYLIARYLGVRNYGVLYGALFGIFAIGAGAGPSLFGRAFDLTGSYDQILTWCALSMLIATALLLSLGRYPERVATAVHDTASTPRVARAG